MESCLEHLESCLEHLYYLLMNSSWYETRQIAKGISVLMLVVDVTRG